MNIQPTFDPVHAASPARPTRAQFVQSDDKAMLRAVRDLTRDIGEARAAIYCSVTGMQATPRERSASHICRVSSELANPATRSR